ncbi:MAG: L,D-transpeptidase [Verrucomicrobia bacterium]|nr:L,D-transpeptidase [Verrucomicrobiota bacterium]
MKTLHSNAVAARAGRGRCIRGIVASVLCLTVAVSCSTTSKSSSSGSSAYFNYDRTAKLPSNPSNVRVKVSLSKQLVYVMEGNEPLLVMPVSVGTSSDPTPTGSYRIGNKDHKHRANTHGFASNGSQVRQTYLNKKPAGWSFKGTPMPYWCGFIGETYGFHVGWLKDRPCTHGCIRMHENLGPKFFRLVSVGNPVSIAHSQPEDTTIGAKVPRPPDATPIPDYPPAFMLGDGYFTKHKSPTYQ